MAKIRKDFSEVLCQKMKDQNINQTDLARLIDVSNTTVGNYMQGKHVPRPIFMRRLIFVLKCSMKDFYDIR